MKLYAFLIMLIIPFLLVSCGADDIDEPAPVKFKSKELHYTVTGPDGCCYPPIWVTGGTVKDGDKDVNADALNTAGIIEIEFTEDVTGHVVLQTENGFDVGWIGTVVGNKAILELVKGRELVNEMTYVVKGKISDAAGNSLDLSVTFVTRGKW